MMYSPTPQQITSWVRKYFPECKPRKGGAELCINNPFDGDTGFNFNISAEKGTAHDWRGDQWAGPVNPQTRRRGCTFIKFVKLFLDCSYAQAASDIAVASGSPVATTSGHTPSWPSIGARGREEATERPLVTLPPGSELVIGSKQGPMAEIVLGWLQRRGLSRKGIAAHKLYHVGTDVVFPYYEYDQLVYWQTRSAINKVFRFPDEDEFGVSKGMFLYNFDNIEPASYMAVTESIFGCYTVGEQCCATGGADISDMQISKIELLGPRDGVILAPDNDKAAAESIVRNGAKLKARNLRVLYSMPPAMAYRDSDGKDKLTKDWNELHTHAKMPLADIRRAFEDGIRPLDGMATIQLMRFVAQSGKKKAYMSQHKQ